MNKSPKSLTNLVRNNSNHNGHSEIYNLFSHILLNMPYLYILVCADNSYYTGSTWNLEKRLWDHQQGLGSAYTKKRLPVRLVYCEEYKRIIDAYHREKEIQKWSRRKKEALISGNTNDLVRFSKNYQQFGKASNEDLG